MAKMKLSDIFYYINDNLELVEDHGMAVEAMDLYGRSARDLAAEHDHTAVVEYLESQGG